MLLQCLRYESDLYDRFEVGAHLAKFDSEVQMPEARYAELLTRGPQGQAHIQAR